MLQYLLNVTCIWLLSLVLFDVFLLRESYHGYNRIYLLATFVLGIVMPLIQWQGSVAAFAVSLPDVVVLAVQAKENFAMPATSEAQYVQWLAAVYFAGVAFTTGRLLLEIIKLVVYYRAGLKAKQDYWTIVETNKPHAPFSFARLLFVENISKYTEAEWQMLAAHERAHTQLAHLADLVLLRLTHIVLWWHPLVYVYTKRLLMVHEYQADRTCGRQPQHYSKFLVEQSLLHTAPFIAHSFNRSPIKNRIVMLTRRSSKIAGIKMLVLLPLSAVCITLFSKEVHAQSKAAAQSEVFTYVELMPEATFDMAEFIGSNIHYPDSARKKGTEGRVIVKFIVNEDGKVSDVRVMKGIGDGCDEEALRVVTMMPPWKPGKQNGKKVKVYFTIPIMFKLA